MKQVIDFLEGAKISAQDAIDSLPKNIDEHSAKIATDNQEFIKEIDQALLVLSNVRKPKGTVCDHKKVNPYFAPVDECDKCGELIRQ